MIAIFQWICFQLGLTTKDLADHFAGPAFLPWQRMGNMEQFGGPLPPMWHNFTVGIQHQVINDTIYDIAMTFV